MSRSNGDDNNGLPELIEALRSFRSGQAEVTGGQRAIIEEHALLKQALAGPALLTPGPVIAQVNPLAGAPNDTVTITGTRLADVTLVRIGAGRVTEFEGTPTDTQIVLKVPADATTGVVSVFTPLGVAITEQEFQVVQTSKKRGA